MTVSTDDELQALRRVGAVVRETIDAMAAAVAPGVTTQQLDEVAAEVVARHGARSAPQLVYDFPGVTCICVADEAVHGIPGPRVLAAGELVTLDVTLELDGYMADAARTVVVGGGESRLIATAEAALRRALDTARAGVPVREVGATVQRIVEARGFSVLHELTGHGIGRSIHEPPTVPNVPVPDQPDVLTEGLVMTIEPIIAAGTSEVVHRDDGWTIATADGSDAAHAEHTIVIQADAPPLILTG
jgi:methionyl aminopeptidase